MGKRESRKKDLRDSNGTMNDLELIEAAKDQLNRILGFFPRAEAKASVVFGIDVSMLALLAINAPAIKSFEWYMLFAVIPVVLIGASLYYLYQGSFPRLDGGAASLIYFREVATKTESNFIEAFREQTKDAYIKDILGQIWRNSEILKQKFDHLKFAFTFLAWAILPWGISLAMFAAKNTSLTNLLAK
jgi:hypothetical protein